jgi:hypothetical protein
MSIFAKISGFDNPTTFKIEDNIIGIDNWRSNDSVSSILGDYTVQIPTRVMNAVMSLANVRQFDNSRLNKIMEMDLQEQNKLWGRGGDDIKSEVTKSFLKAELSNITQGYPYYFQMAEKLFTFGERMKAATDYFNPNTQIGSKNLTVIGFKL